MNSKIVCGVLGLNCCFLIVIAICLQITSCELERQNAVLENVSNGIGLLGEYKVVIAPSFYNSHGQPLTKFNPLDLPKEITSKTYRDKIIVMSKDFQQLHPDGLRRTR